jgi:Zn-dependent peptidase ImmA (M78 family)
MADNYFLLEKEASGFRNEHGLGSTDPIRLKSLLQKLNIITVFSPLKDAFSGMALKVIQSDVTYRFMLVNSNQSLGKQHFTVCHELYHLCIQKDFSARLCQTGLFEKKDDINEYNADIFASFLLLPTEGLLSNIDDQELETRKISLPTILYLENFFGCSRRALLYRLKGLKLISNSEYTAFCTNVKRGALENGYEISLYEAGNNKLVIGDYGAVAKSLFDGEQISQSHYYSLLGDLGIDISQISDSETNEA